MKKRILAILLAIALVVVMAAGCAPAKESGGSESESSKTAETSKTDESSKTDKSDSEPENPWALPYTGEEITFHYYWFDTGADFTSEDYPIVQALKEKHGNIKLELEILSYEDYMTKSPLILAGGELPDLMLLNGPAGYLSTYGTTGIFLDYAEYMKDWMPNVYKYSQKVKMYETLRDAEGHQYALPLNVTTEDRIMSGWGANKTLLDELNIKIPETRDEVLDVLRKVKAEKDIVPFQRRNGLPAVIDSMGLMFKNNGDRSLSYYPDEGKWDFGPTREDSELKELLKFMNILWTEELIDHELNTQTEEMVLDYLYAGQFALTHDYHVRFGIIDDPTSDRFNEALDIVVFPTPAGSGRYETIANPCDGAANWGVFSDKNTEYPELMLSCLDIIYSDEIGIIANYGIEGLSYELGDDGLPYFKEGVVRTAYAGFTGDKSMADFGYWKSPWLRAFGIQDTRSVRMIEETPAIFDAIENKKSMLDAGEIKPRYYYSYPTLTAEESTEISDIYAPVNTYLSECIYKFVMGDMNIDADWDTFMTNLKSYGDMDRVCEILNSKENVQFSGNWR